MSFHFLMPARYLSKALPALLWVMCGSVFAQAPAALEDIRGPKPLVEIPVEKEFPLTLVLSVAGGMLLLVLIILGCIALARKRRPLAADLAALSALKQLEASQNDLVAGAFANYAAGTVRQYIAARFGIAAPKKTTEEFFRHIAKDDASGLLAHGEHLRAFLKACDLAKFAGAGLDAGGRAELLETAREFIRSTAPVAGKKGGNA